MAKFGHYVTFEQARSQIEARAATSSFRCELTGTGQTDEQRLVISALTYLKSMEMRANAAKP